MANWVICRSRLNAKINRNFEVFRPTDFLAAITQHIPDKGAQMVRYDGLFSATWSRGRTRLPEDLHRALRDHISSVVCQAAQSEYCQPALLVMAWTKSKTTCAVAAAVILGTIAYQVGTMPGRGSEHLRDGTRVVIDKLS